MLSIINIILGAALLVAGRRLFWLFIMAGGFVAGVQFATNVIKGPEWLAIVIGLVVGIIFAILARFLKALTIGIAGFVLGGSILSAFASASGYDANWLIWLAGGIIGVILVSFIFDWALIFLSAFAGAALLIQEVNLSDIIKDVGFIVLLIIGIFVQIVHMRSRKNILNDG